VRNLRRIGLSLVLAVVLLVGFTVPALATNPTVAITVTAQVVSITNSQNTWTMGIIDTSATVYFSANNLEDVDYSLITNTGSVAEDVEIQGTIIEGGTYDWTWDTTPGDQIFSLYAYNVSSAAYDIPVKPTPFSDIVVDLPATGSDTYTWSMKFMGPTAFNANDDSLEKSATVTLVASKHV
jgi:hypothetical protein